jgi:putative transposase
MYCDKSAAFDFLTLRCRSFSNPWKDAASKKRLLGKLKAAKKRLGLSVAAYVVLDDHAHILLRAQAGQGGTKLLDELRAGFCDDCQMMTSSSDSTSADLEHRALVGSLQARAHLDFIHYEPVLYGLVDRAVDYDWSSFPVRVAQGHFPENWAALAPPASIARVPL